jgi:small subunit ribosomal protein S6
MLLLDNREVRQGWQALKDNVAGMFRKHGTEIASSRLWDERRLAYPIARQRRGTYLLVYFKSETRALAGLRRDLELSEVVLRNLIRTCEEIPSAAFEPEPEFDESKIREEDVSQPQPAPEVVEADAGEAKASAEGNREEEAPARRARAPRREKDEKAAGDTGDKPAAGDEGGER